MAVEHYAGYGRRKQAYSFNDKNTWFVHDDHQQVHVEKYFCSKE